ncbi:MAG TPA: Flp family type IVb pilin [Gemmatimonadaceae bacterium]
MDRIRNFAREDDGATMTEYGIMLALIAAVCIVIVTTLGTQVKAAFTTVSDAITPTAP